MISLRFWLIMLSRVMISQPRTAAYGIQSVRPSDDHAIGLALAERVGRALKSAGRRRCSCRQSPVTVTGHPGAQAPGDELVDTVLAASLADLRGAGTWPPR